MSRGEQSMGRRDKGVQCNLAQLDAEEVERMTIQSIREELKKHLGDTTGRKPELVVRLLWFRKQAFERREGEQRKRKGGGECEVARLWAARGEPKGRGLRSGSCDCACFVTPLVSVAANFPVGTQLLFR